MTSQLLPGLSTGRTALYIGAIVLKTLLFLPLPLLYSHNSGPASSCMAGTEASAALDLNGAP